MRFSEQINEIAAAMSAAQGEFRTLAKLKDNPFFKSKYSDLPAHVELLREILPRHGLAFSQGQETVDGEVKLATLIMHTSGQWIVSHSPWYANTTVERDKQGGIVRTYVKPQDGGSGSTYARRYGLAAAFGIVSDESDDDGNEANGNRTKAKAAAADLDEPSF